MMNIAATARATTYATSCLFGLAMLAKVLGYAEFDASTGMVYPVPFSIYGLVPFFALIISSGMAFIAVIKGWGTKKDDQ